MSPREKMDMKIVRFSHDKPEHTRMVSELMDRHWKELQENILRGDVTKEKAVLAQTAKRAYEKKMNRAATSMRDGKAVAHIVYTRGKDRWKNDIHIPVGFIFSHKQIAPPLHEHLEELQAQFPELEGLTQAELEGRVLFGEHGYVVPEYHNRRIGADLIAEHEKDAQQNGRNYTHRMISLWGPEAHLEEMLKKKGYIRLAVRKSGAIIMAKKLKPEPSK